MAIFVSLFATVVLTCLGLTLALLGSTEVTLAANDAQAKAAVHAAGGALTLALSELRGREDWSGVIAAGTADICADPGALVDPSLFPRAPWDGSTVDLHALTAALQAASDAAAASTAARPEWRLFEYGPISRLMPSAAPPWYLVAWASDGRDGVLLVHATALGPGGLTASVEASVTRGVDGRSLRRMAVRSWP